MIVVTMPRYTSNTKFLKWNTVAIVAVPSNSNININKMTVVINNESERRYIGE